MTTVPLFDPSTEADYTMPDPEPRYKRVDLAELFARGLSTEVPTILARTDTTCLFYRGAVNSVIGESESGKTWLTLLAVKQEIQAGNKVMFLDFEDTAVRVVKRLLDMELDEALIKERFIYISPEGEFGDVDREHFLALGLAQCTLVVIDGVTEAMSLHGLNGREEMDVATFYEIMPKWLAAQGPAVVLIDHMAKSKEGRGNSAIGSQHKRAAITGASYIVENKKPMGRGRDGESSIVLAKDKPGGVEYSSATSTRYIGMLHVESDPAIFVVSAYIKPGGSSTATHTSTTKKVPTASDKKHDMMLKILDFVKTESAGKGKAPSGNQIKACVGGTASAVGEFIAELEDEGYIENISKTSRPAWVFLRDYDES